MEFDVDDVASELIELQSADLDALISLYEADDADYDDDPDEAGYDPYSGDYDYSDSFADTYLDF